MIVADAANFLLGGIPGDLYEMFVVDVEPGDLTSASHTLRNMSTSVKDIHVKLSGSVASLEGRWEGSGAATFDSEIWQPLSHGLGTLERECATAAGKLADLAMLADAAHMEKVEQLNQEIQTQLLIFAGTSLIGGPELGGVISDAVGGLAARLGGELVGRVVSGIVDAITTLIERVLGALGQLLEYAGRPLTSVIQDLGGKVVDVIERLGDDDSPRSTGGAASQSSGNAPAFGNQSLREGHFDKHVGGQGEFRGFGYANASDYERGAQNLVANPDRMYFERSSGRVVHYLEDTNEFAITTPESTINTYFQPDEGLSYFVRELMRG